MFNPRALLWLVAATSVPCALFPTRSSHAQTTYWGYADKYAPAVASPCGPGGCPAPQVSYHSSSYGLPSVSQSSWPVVSSPATVASSALAAPSYVSGYASSYAVAPSIERSYSGWMPAAPVVVASQSAPHTASAVYSSAGYSSAGYSSSVSAYPTSQVIYPSQPVTSVPLTNMPVTNMPVTSMPVTSMPVTSQPMPVYPYSMGMPAAATATCAGGNCPLR